MRRAVRCRTQISTRVKLGAKKNDGHEQGQDGYSRCALTHVLRTTELRQEWLRGQGLAGRLRIFATNWAAPPSKLLQ
jgi:hypothetical protein